MDHKLLEYVFGCSYISYSLVVGMTRLGVILFFFFGSELNVLEILSLEGKLGILT